MSLSNREARDSIVTTFLSAWQAQSPAIVGYEPAVAYDNVEFDPPTNQHWLRLSIQHSQSRQATFGGPGQRYFRHSGTVTAQLFMQQNEGLSAGDQLAEIIISAFEGTSTDDGLTFRNVRSTEIGTEGSWFQINISAAFEYGKLR